MRASPDHRTATVPALPAGTALPRDRNPAAVYLASLAEGPGRRSMRSTLAHVAGALGFELESCPWHHLRYQHVQALRSAFSDRFAPATTNKYLSAIRQVSRQAWLLGWMAADDHHRIAAVKNVRGARLPPGHALDGGELRALFAACADGSPAGARDAAAFALMFGCGLRRAEAAAVELDDYDPEAGALRVIGKGNRQRQVHAPTGARAAIEAWIAVRGTVTGPLLSRVGKGGHVQAGAGLSPHALMLRLRRRAQQAGIRPCTPHDLRRTFVSSALEAGADLSLVQQLAGHASPTTTARYDRRPDAARARAAQLVHVPFTPAPAKLPGGSPA